MYDPKEPQQYSRQQPSVVIVVVVEAAVVDVKMPKVGVVDHETLYHLIIQIVVSNLNLLQLFDP